MHSVLAAEGGYPDAAFAAVATAHGDLDADLTDVIGLGPAAGDEIRRRLTA